MKKINSVNGNESIRIQHHPKRAFDQKEVKVTKKLKVSNLPKLPNVMNNYVASFLATRKEVYHLALVLRTCTGEVPKLKESSRVVIDFSDEKNFVEPLKESIYQIIDKKMGFWQIDMRLISKAKNIDCKPHELLTNGWFQMVSWLKNNPEFAIKVLAIYADRITSTDIASPNNLSEVFSLCKNLISLTIKDCNFHKSVTLLDSAWLKHDALEKFEITSQKSMYWSCNELAECPRLKSFSAWVSLDAQDSEKMSEVTKLLNKYRDIKLMIWICTLEGLNAIINWFNKNPKFLENDISLDGEYYSLIECNIDRWGELIEKVKKLNFLKIGSIEVPYSLKGNANNSVLRVFDVSNISKNLTLTDFPMLEYFNFSYLDEGVTITLKGLSNLKKINGQEIVSSLRKFKICYEN